MQNEGAGKSSWWTLNPEYAYVMLTSGGDGKDFLQACCSKEVQLAYSLVKHGPMQADLFRTLEDYKRFAFDRPEWSHLRGHEDEIDDIQALVALDT